MPKTIKPKKTKVHKNTEKMIELCSKASKIHRQYRKAYMQGYQAQLIKMFESNNKPITKNKKKRINQSKKDF